MQNESSKESVEQAAPNISADFLTGSTEIGLDRIRTRLLDLTNRNKLLNFRHSNVSSLRVVAVPMETVFGRLRHNEKLAFLSVPEPEFEGAERPAAKDYAAELDWNTSFDLDAAPDDSASSLPVLHYQEQLDTVSRKIASAAKTAIEESGTNMLYLVFDDTPESYFKELATLALLSFGKLLMYRDLDPKTWPAAQSIAKHPLVRELFEGTKNPNITLAEEYDIDAPVPYSMILRSAIRCAGHSKIPVISTVIFPWSKRRSNSLQNTRRLSTRPSSPLRQPSLKFSGHASGAART